MSPFQNQSNKKNAYNSSNPRQDYRRTDDTKQRQKKSQNKFAILQEEDSSDGQEINIVIPQAPAQDVRPQNRFTSNGNNKKGYNALKFQKPNQEINIVFPQASAQNARPQNSFTSNGNNRRDRNIPEFQKPKQENTHPQIVNNGVQRPQKSFTPDGQSDVQKTNSIQLSDAEMDQLYKKHKIIPQLDLKTLYPDSRNFEDLKISINDNEFAVFDMITRNRVKTYNTCNPYQQFTTNPEDRDYTTKPVYRQPAVIIRKKVVQCQVQGGQVITLEGYQTFETFTIKDSKELMFLSGKSNLQLFEKDPITKKPIKPLGVVTTPNDAYLKFNTDQDTKTMKHILQSFGGQQINIMLKYDSRSINGKKEVELPIEPPQYSPFSFQHLKAARNTIIKYQGDFIDLGQYWLDEFDGYPQITFKIPMMSKLYNREWAFPDYNFQFSANFEEELDKQKYIAAHFVRVKFNRMKGQNYQQSYIQFLRIIVSHDEEVETGEQGEQFVNGQKVIVPITRTVKKMLFVPYDQSMSNFQTCYRPIIGKVQITKSLTEEGIEQIETLEIEEQEKATMDDIDTNYQSIYFQKMDYHDDVPNWKDIQMKNIDIVKKNLNDMVYLRRFYVRYIAFFEKVIDQKPYVWDFFCLVEKDNPMKYKQIHLTDQQLSLFKISDKWMVSQLRQNKLSSEEFFKPLITDLTLLLDNESVKEKGRYDLQFFQDKFIEYMGYFINQQVKPNRMAFYNATLKEFGAITTIKKYNHSILDLAYDDDVQREEIQIADPYYNACYKLIRVNFKYDQFVIDNYYLPQIQTMYGRLTAFNNYCKTFELPKSIENIYECCKGKQIDETIKNVYNMDDKNSWFSKWDQNVYNTIAMDQALTPDQKASYQSVYKFIVCRTTQLYLSNQSIVDTLLGNVKIDEKETEKARIARIKREEEQEIAFLKELIPILRLEMMFYLRRAIERDHLATQKIVNSEEKNKDLILKGYPEFNALELRIKATKMRYEYLIAEDRTQPLNILPEDVFFMMATYYSKVIDSNLGNFENRNGNGRMTGIALCNLDNVFSHFIITDEDPVFENVPHNVKVVYVENINQLMQLTPQVKRNIFLWTKKGLNYQVKLNEVEPTITNNTTVADLIKVYQPNPSFIDNDRQ